MALHSGHLHAAAAVVPGRACLAAAHCGRHVKLDGWFCLQTVVLGGIWCLVDSAFVATKALFFILISEGAAGSDCWHVCLTITREQLCCCFSTMKPTISKSH